MRCYKDWEFISEIKNYKELQGNVDDSLRLLSSAIGRRVEGCYTTEGGKRKHSLEG